MEIVHYFRVHEGVFWVLANQISFSKNHENTKTRFEASLHA